MILVSVVLLVIRIFMLFGWMKLFMNWCMFCVVSELIEVLVFELVNGMVYVLFLLYSSGGSVCSVMFIGWFFFCVICVSYWLCMCVMLVLWNVGLCMMLVKSDSEGLS